MKSLYSLLCWNQNICKTFYFFLCWSDAVLTMPFLCIEHVLHVDIGQFRFNRGVIIWSSCASSILSINELTEDSGSHTIFAQWETLTQHQHQRQQKKKKSEITYWIWLTWFPLSSLDWATANDEKKTRGIACGKFRYFLFVLLLCLLFEEWTFGSIIIYEIYVKALNAIRMTARWFRFFFFYFFIILIIIKVLMHAAAAATWSRAYLFPQFFVVVLFTSTEIKWLWILGMR